MKKHLIIFGKLKLLIKGVSTLIKVIHTKGWSERTKVPEIGTVGNRQWLKTPKSEFRPSLIQIIK